MRRLLAATMATLSIGGALAVVGASAASAATAQAATDCDELVVDRTSGSALPRAQDVASRLDESPDVFARARVIDDSGGELEAWLDDEVASCPAWQTGDGFRRADLLVVVVDMDARVIGSFFGERLVSQEAQVENVHDLMRPALAEGDVDGALAAGLEGWGDRLGIDTAAPASPLPWVAGGVVLVGGGAGAVALSRRRRRTSVQGVAIEAKTATMSAWFDLESRWETIQAAVTVMTQAVHPDDGVAATVEQEADEAERALAEVREDLLAVPDPDDVTTQQEADDAVAAWTSIGERVAAVTVEVDEVEAAVAILSEAKQTGPARVEEADAAVARARAAVAAVGEAQVDGTPLRAEAAAAWAQDAAKGAEAARTALDQGRFGDALQAAATATGRAQEAIARAEAVPNLARELPVRAADVARLAEAAEKAAVSSKNALTTLRSQWRRTVWDDISDAPEHAAELAAEAAELAADAADAASVEEQDWDGAIAALDEAESLLAESAELAAAPRARDEQARSQLDAARATLEDARRRAAEAESALARTPADVDAHRTSLAAASRQVEKAAALLDDKPDPIRANQIGAEAVAAIQRAAAGARDVMASWERERQRAERTLQQARRDLDQAERDRPRSSRHRNDLRTANAIYGDAASELERDPRAAADQAQRALDLARRIIRDKRRERDGDRDQWRATGGRSVIGGGFGGIAGRGSVLGSPSRSSRTSRSSSSSSRARVSSKPSRSSSSRSSSSSRRRGGGGTSKF